MKKWKLIASASLASFLLIGCGGDSSKSKENNLYDVNSYIDSEVDDEYLTGTWMLVEERESIFGSRGNIESMNVKHDRRAIINIYDNQNGTVNVAYCNDEFIGEEIVDVTGGGILMPIERNVMLEGSILNNTRIEGKLLSDNIVHSKVEMVKLANNLSLSKTERFNIGTTSVNISSNSESIREFNNLPIECFEQWSYETQLIISGETSYRSGNKLKVYALTESESYQEADLTLAENNKLRLIYHILYPPNSQDNLSEFELYESDIGTSTSYGLIENYSIPDLRFSHNTAEKVHLNMLVNSDGFSDRDAEITLRIDI